MRNFPFFDWTTVTSELKRRGVYPVIVGYAVAGWLVLQIGEVTFRPLHLPEATMTILIVSVILGFPVVVALSWFFDLTRHGIRRDIKPLSIERHGDSRPSIAVLPFADMSAEQDQGYFCEGVAEEILNALTKIDRLRVVARSSSFQYNTHSGDIRKIGEELGVRAVLEGSVRKSGDHLRVTAQLVKVADGCDLWSKRFDKELKDIFSIQDEIATSIAMALLETIAPNIPEKIQTTFSKHVSAYDFYLRGRQFIKRFHRMDIEFARQMFRHAIDIDPDFGLAWAGYADCFSLMVMYQQPEDNYKSQARKASRRALALSPGLAEAHASRGLALLISDNYASAEAHFHRALELNPRLFEAYYYYGRARFHQGDLQKAAELFSKAAEVDPADYQSRCLRVQILRGTGRTQEAIRQAKEAIPVIEKHLEWNPDDARALHLGAGSLIVLGQTERAKRWLKRALVMDPDDSVLLYNVACNYVTLGELDLALDHLEHAIDNGMVNTAWLEHDEDLKPLRTHPRYLRMTGDLKAADNASWA